MTPAQLTALKAFIDSVPEWAALPQNSDTAYFIAGELNKTATPTFTVWKTSVHKNDVGKAFVSSALAAITAGNNDKLANFAAWNEYVNPSRLDQRAFFDDVFSVAAGATTRAALLVLWKRPATVYEKLFATGTGTDASPATMTLEGTIAYSWVEAARAL
jgi:hypothetical protein